MPQNPEKTNLPTNLHKFAQKPQKTNLPTNLPQPKIFFFACKNNSNQSPPPPLSCVQCELRRHMAKTTVDRETQFLFCACAQDKVFFIFLGQFEALLIFHRKSFQNFSALRENEGIFFLCLTKRKVTHIQSCFFFDRKHLIDPAKLLFCSNTENPLFATLFLGRCFSLVSNWLTPAP